MALASAMLMATQHGTVGPRGANTPPKAGPTTNPNPVAAPIRPMPFVRFSTGVTSATTACAEPIFEAPRPPMKRATNNKGEDRAGDGADGKEQGKSFRPAACERHPATIFAPESQS